VFEEKQPAFNFIDIYLLSEFDWEKRFEISWDGGGIKCKGVYYLIG
jgi:hypothetical protein